MTSKPPQPLMTADKLYNLNIQAVQDIWGDLLRRGQRMAVIAPTKSGKSFMVIQLGLHIAAGTPYLEMPTSQANVLYLNFEVSPEKLQERIRDLCDEMGMLPPPGLILETVGALALESDPDLKRLDDLLQRAEKELGSVGVLIIDPRRNAMGGDENQSETLNDWDKSIDHLRVKYDLAVVVVVHHTGKQTTGAGRGSSVFDGWLDTILMLDPEEDLRTVAMSVQGRDTERRTVQLEFRYPLWRVAPIQAKMDNNAVNQAKALIDDRLSKATGHQIEQNVLKRLARREGHSEYAIKRALDEAERHGQIRRVQDKSKHGNWKIVESILPPAQAAPVLENLK